MSAATHFQNQHDFDPYMAKLREGPLPIYRALTPTEEERMIRELILQMKLGQVSRRYFQDKFGVDVPAALRRAARACCGSRDSSACDPTGYR